MEYGESTAESAELMTCDWCFATAQQPHPQRCLGEPQHDQLWRSIADHFAHESGVPHPGAASARPQQVQMWKSFAEHLSRQECGVAPTW